MKLFLKVKPRAKKNEVRKINNEYYEVFTTSVPENGKANEEIINLIAKYFHIGKKKIKISKGLHCKEKIIEIDSKDIDSKIISNKTNNL